MEGSRGESAAAEAARVGEITVLLKAWAAGDQQAQEALFEQIYPTLRRLARQRLSFEPAAISIQATELAHEAYLRLLQQRGCSWQSRTHFFAVAATLLRRILVDHAKRRLRHKRGRGAVRLSIDDVELPGPEPDLDLLALDEALVELAQVRATTARMVELRYFAGLSLDETAEILGVGRTTVKRKWRFARSWLARRLGKVS